VVVKRRLQRVYPLETVLGSTGFGGYIRAGRFEGRGAVDAGPEIELEGATRDNVVRGASGLVCVRWIDECETGAPNSEVIVT
jgi:hypothetical protein